VTAGAADQVPSFRGPPGGPGTSSSAGNLPSRWVSGGPFTRCPARRGANTRSSSRRLRQGMPLAPDASLERFGLPLRAARRRRAVCEQVRASSSSDAPEKYATALLGHPRAATGVGAYGPGHNRGSSSAPTGGRSGSVHRRASDFSPAPVHPRETRSSRDTLVLYHGRTHGGRGPERGVRGRGCQRAGGRGLPARRSPRLSRSSTHSSAGSFADRPHAGGREGGSSTDTMRRCDDRPFVRLVCRRKAGHLPERTRYLRGLRSRDTRGSSSRLPRRGPTPPLLSMTCLESEATVAYEKSGLRPLPTNGTS